MAEVKFPNDNNRYPPNSLSKPMLQPVVDRSNKSARGSFLARALGAAYGQRASDIITYSMDNIIRPRSKDLAYNLITTIARMIIYKDARDVSRGNDWDSVNRNASVYHRDRFNSAGSRGSYPNDNRTSFNWQAYNDFDHKDEAQRVLDGLIYQIENMDDHVATVAEFCQLNDVRGWDWTLQDWGWPDLSQAEVRYIMGKFRITLPDPIYLKGRR